jgi:hypothetical protein
MVREIDVDGALSPAAGPRRNLRDSIAVDRQRGRAEHTVGKDDVGAGKENHDRPAMARRAAPIAIPSAPSGDSSQRN